MKMTATRSMTYATRRLRPGETFQASPRDARVLSAIGKAAPAVEEPVEPPAPLDQPDDLDALRSEAMALGIDVDRRWGAKRLRAEIEQSKA